MSSECVPSGPGAEHQLFRPFVGQFRTTVTLWMGPGEPMVHTGTMRNSLVLGGRFLRQDYKGDPMEGPYPPFEGEGYWGYNDARAKWEGVWVDSASNQMQTEAGDYDAATRSWTMLGAAHVPNGTMAKRSVIRLISDHEHETESFLQWPDGSWTKTMHLRFVRA